MSTFLGNLSNLVFSLDGTITTQQNFFINTTSIYVSLNATAPATDIAYSSTNPSILVVKGKASNATTGIGLIATTSSFTGAAAADICSGGVEGYVLVNGSTPSFSTKRVGGMYFYTSGSGTTAANGFGGKMQMFLKADSATTYSSRMVATHDGTFYFGGDTTTSALVVVTNAANARFVRITGATSSGAVTIAASAGNLILDAGANIIRCDSQVLVNNIGSRTNNLTLTGDGAAGYVRVSTIFAFIATSNQIAFGDTSGTHTKITHTVPGTSRVYTIPDAATTNATFLLSEGTYTVNSVLTFTNRLTSPTLIASIYRTVALVLSAGGTTTLPFDTLSFQSSTMWSAGSPTRITVPVAGKYQIIVNAVISSGVNPGVMELTIAINGVRTMFATHSFAANVQWTFSLAPVLNLSATNYVEITYFVTVALCSLSVDAGNRFSVHYLGS